MYPHLFDFPDWIPLIGGRPLTSFGVMMALSFFSAWLILRSEMRRRGFDEEKAFDIVFWAIVGGVVGARLYHLIANPPQGNVLVAAFSRGGLTWYGGLILAAVLVAWKARQLGLRIGDVFDAAAPAMPIAIAVGRVGCFLVGDDYGRPTASAFGVAFPEGSPPTTVEVLQRDFGIVVDPALIEQYGQVLPVHPTQLYEVAIALLVVAPIVWALRTRPHRSGWLFSVWLALYGVERFVLEIFRAKEDRFLFDVFTTAQLLSVGALVAGLWFAWRLSRPEPAGASGAGG